MCIFEDKIIYIYPMVNNKTDENFNNRILSGLKYHTLKYIDAILY